MMQGSAAAALYCTGLRHPTSILTYHSNPVFFSLPLLFSLVCSDGFPSVHLFVHPSVPSYRLSVIYMCLSVILPPCFRGVPLLFVFVHFVQNIPGAIEYRSLSLLLCCFAVGS